MNFVELYGVVFIILFCIALLYIRIAKKFSFYDFPNVRSSHSLPTIIGGGILFPIAALGSIFIPQSVSFQVYGLGIGILILASVGFIDDCIKPVPVIFRIVVQIFSIFLLFYLNELQLNFYTSCLFVLCLYLINASNFMDGVNGMTGLYYVINLSTCLVFYIGENQQDIQIFTTILLLAVCIFLFFNFRNKAIWFAGDVGSTSIAYLFIVVLLMDAEKFSAQYFLFFFIYFLDTGFTILERMILKENIFHGHKKHLYQLLCEHTKLTQIHVSILYSLMQLVINLILLNHTENNILITIVLVVLMIIYIYFKYFVLGKLIRQKM